jgi:hypothetical protein
MPADADAVVGGMRQILFDTEVDTVLERRNQMRSMRAADMALRHSR